MEIKVEQKIKIKVGDVEISVNRDEASSLYEQLKTALGKNEWVYPTWPTYPYPTWKSYPDYTLTTTDGVTEYVYDSNSSEKVENQGS